MSVIEQKSPLNLIGKVAIVTSAATPLGAQTCRTLLRHNCLVLGVDDRDIPESEALFTSKGSHFQRINLNIEDEDAPKRIIEHSRERFSKPDFHLLVTFGKSEGTTKLNGEIGKLMQASGGGVVVSVLDQGTAKESISSKKVEGSNVSTSVVLIDGSDNEEGWEPLKSPEEVNEEVKECVTLFQEVTKDDLNSRKGNKGVAHLLLYLGSELGKQISDVMITANGKWKPL